MACTSFGHVALHSSVCRSGLICSTTAKICYIPPHQQARCWSIKLACSVNLQPGLLHMAHYLGVNQADLADNFADLGLKTHVQHAISLVQNEVLAGLERHLIGKQNTDTWSGSLRQLPIGSDVSKLANTIANSPMIMTYTEGFCSTFAI